jgi:cell division protease FtsH
MSEKLGLATFEEPRQTFLGVGGPVAREYSEATAQAIDVEIAGILSAAHTRVRETLTGRRSALEALAKLLIDKEVVNAEPLRALLAI